MEETLYVCSGDAPGNQQLAQAKADLIDNKRLPLWRLIGCRAAVGQYRAVQGTNEAEIFFSKKVNTDANMFTVERWRRRRLVVRRQARPASRPAGAGQGGAAAEK